MKKIDRLPFLFSNARISGLFVDLEIEHKSELRCKLDSQFNFEHS